MRPCKSIEGFKTLYDDVDVVTIRWVFIVQVNGKRGGVLIRKLNIILVQQTNKQKNILPLPVFLNICDINLFYFYSILEYANIIEFYIF